MKVSLCSDSDWLLSEEAYSVYAPCMYQPTYKKYIFRMKQYISDPSVRIYVCEKDVKKAGILVLNVSYSTSEIQGIAVAEDMRRQGIGKEMILKVMEAEGLDTVRAWTDDDAIGFYRRCGFSDTRVVTEFSDGSAVLYNCIMNTGSTDDM